MRRKLTQNKRLRIYNKTNGHCAYCGCALQLKEMQIDHIKPVAHGGTDEEHNLYASCRSCNHRKGMSEIESFRKQIEQFLYILNRDSVTYRNAVRFGLIVPAPHKVEFYFEKEMRRYAETLA